MNPKEWEQKCSEIRGHYTQSVQNAVSPAELESLKVQCLGRKGALTELLKALKDFSLEDKKILGVAGNSLKNELTAVFDSKAQSLEASAINSELDKVSLDLTLPGYPFPKGSLHPLSVASERMRDILSKLGFVWASGPHIETEYYNFDALNIPANHPARDVQDTLYLKRAPGEEKLLLRTHTSPVQIRYMKDHKPPLRVMAPGSVFRNDPPDAGHSPQFNQIEGFYVDKNVTMADLKGTLTSFMKGLFGGEATIRFRPSFFPFVEPGVEVDVRCVFCGGKGHCSVCKSTGWIEMLGAGMIHPNVLKSVNIDSNEWSGFAFGIGVERLVMVMYGIKDIRMFYENDLRILKQF